jgi:uracil-DNA glycosylase
MTVRIEPSWHAVLSEEFEKPYWHELTQFVKEEYQTQSCFPSGKNIFKSFDLTPFDSVKVVIL